MICRFNKHTQEISHMYVHLSQMCALFVCLFCGYTRQKSYESFTSIQESTICSLRAKQSIAFIARHISWNITIKNIFLSIFCFPDSNIYVLFVCGWRRLHSEWNISNFDQICLSNLNFDQPGALKIQIVQLILMY